MATYESRKIFETKHQEWARRVGVLLDSYSSCPHCEGIFNALADQFQEEQRQNGFDKAGESLNAWLISRVCPSLGLKDVHGEPLPWAVYGLAKHVRRVAGFGSAPIVWIDPSEEEVKLPGIAVHVVAGVVAVRIPGETVLWILGEDGEFLPESVAMTEFEDTYHQGYSVHDMQKLGGQLRKAVPKAIEFATDRSKKIHRDGAQQKTIDEKEPRWLGLLHCQLVHRSVVLPGLPAKEREGEPPLRLACGCLESKADSKQMTISDNDIDLLEELATSMSINFPNV